MAVFSKQFLFTIRAMEVDWYSTDAMDHCTVGYFHAVAMTETPKPKSSPAPRSAADRLLNLAKVGWLSQMPAEFQARIAAMGHWATLRRGAILYSIGDESTAIYGLNDGMLDVAMTINSVQEVVVHRATVGFWIGDSGVLSNSPRAISVSCSADSKVFVLPAAAVRRNLEANPADWAYFCHLSHLNASLAMRVLAEVVALPSRVRFARTLLRLIAPDDVIHATQEELGRMVGMSRAAFRRNCATLITRGIIEVEYGSIRVRNRTALELEAENVDE